MDLDFIFIFNFRQLHIFLLLGDSTGEESKQNIKVIFGCARICRITSKEKFFRPPLRSA